MNHFYTTSASFMKLEIWSSLKVYCNCLKKEHVPEMKKHDWNQSEAGIWVKSLCPRPFVQTWPHSSRPLFSEWCSLLTMLIAKFISAESCLHLQPVSVFRRLRQKRIPWCKSLRSKSLHALLTPHNSTLLTHTRHSLTELSCQLVKGCCSSSAHLTLLNGSHTLK